MIQRIQTVYLLIALVLSGVCMGFEVMKDGHPWALIVLTGLSALLEFVGIFLFRRRALQMRLCTFCILLLIGWYAVYAAFAYLFGDGLVGDYRPAPWAAIPAINAILLYLAFRGILKDELLVRSLDRLR